MDHLHIMPFIVATLTCPCLASATVAKQRLLLILMDGFRYDYLDQSDIPLPGFAKIIEKGVRPKYLIPDFPSLSYPNYYSIMTGLHTESHGMTGNYMYDVTRNESFLMGTNPEQFHEHWWDGGEPLWRTAIRQGKSVYMYYWLGCEVPVHNIYPTYCRNYTGVPSIDDFRYAINESICLLDNGTADVAAIYFEQTDSVGHKYGPLSMELKNVLRDLDPIMSNLVDQLQTESLSGVNLMIFSDHGMTEIDQSRVINITSQLSPDEYDTVLEFAAIASIYTKPNMTDKVYNRLQKFHPNMTVYLQSDLLDRWNYKNGKYVSQVTLVADEGWFILTPFMLDIPLRPEDNKTKKGWHGYDVTNLDMMGVFLGMGSAFQHGSKSNPIHVVDLYQVMCDILGIQAAPNNGSQARVVPLLSNATSLLSVTNFYWALAACLGLLSHFLMHWHLEVLHA